MLQPLRESQSLAASGTPISIYTDRSWLAEIPEVRYWPVTDDRSLFLDQTEIV
jgi:hypothetical protein